MSNAIATTAVALALGTITIIAVMLAMSVLAPALSAVAGS